MTIETFVEVFLKTLILEYVSWEGVALETKEEDPEGSGGHHINWQRLVANELVSKWERVITNSGGGHFFRVVLTPGDPYLVRAFGCCKYGGPFVSFGAVEFFRVELKSTGDGAFVFSEHGEEKCRIETSLRSIVENSTDELLAKIADRMKNLRLEDEGVRLGF